MVDTDKRCPRCDGFVQDDKSASLTQWMFQCRCNLNSVSDQSIDTQLCSRCGKRIAVGRNGSLTQWVFGSSICACSIRTSANDDSDSPLQIERSEIDKNVGIDLEEGLEVDPMDFPSDRYKPLLKLGSGAFGEVFLCRDRMLKNKVALKRLHQLMPDQLISFQNEARSTSSLNHPSIINIRDFGVTVSGAPYMVMEYFPGENLRSFIKTNGPLPWKAALSMASKLCEALDCAHKHGIFHRDLKPENVLLSINESNELDLRLIDFGIANFSSANQTTTAQGITLVGTPAYMSPDQASGLKFDARSEVYSLGCVLYEALCGRPPFLAETALEALSKHMNSVPESISSLADVPAEIDSIVQKCLKKNPDDRFQSMEELGLRTKSFEQASTEFVPLETLDSRSEVISSSRQPKSVSVIASFLALIIFGGSSITFLVWKFAFSSPEAMPVRGSFEDNIELATTVAKQNIELDRVVFDKAPPAGATIKKFYKKADELFALQNRFEAERLYGAAYDECLKYAPNHPQLNYIRYRLAVCMMGQPSKYKEAEDLLRLILEDLGRTTSSSIAIDAELALAQVLCLKGQYIEAESQTKRCLNRSPKPDVASALSANLFVCYWRQKKFDKAESLLKTILADKNTSLAYRMTLLQIVLLLQEKQDPRVEQLCRRALANGDENGKDDLSLMPGWQLLRAILVKKGKYAEARTLIPREFALCQSDKIEPRQAAQKFIELSSVCKTLEMNQLALSCCDQAAIRMNNKNVPEDLATARLLETLVRTYCGLSAAERTQQINERIINLYVKFDPPNAVAFPIFMGNQCMADPDCQQARSYFELALKNYKKLPQKENFKLFHDIHTGLLNLADHDLATGKYESAEAILEQMGSRLTESEQRKRHDTLLISSYRFQFKVREAENLFADKYRVPNLEVEFQMAAIYMEAGVLDKAKIMFDKVFNESGCRTTTYALTAPGVDALICQLKGQNEESEKLWRKVESIERSPSLEHPVYRFFLASLLEKLGKSKEAESFKRKAFEEIKQNKFSPSTVQLWLIHFSKVFENRGRDVEAKQFSKYAQECEKQN